MPVDLGFHWSMLNDYDRNAAYRAAIRRTAPDRIVYDLGAGVGPLSYYALTAGARRVYGFEVDRDALPYLRQLAHEFPNFTPCRADVLRAALPREVPDVIICEMWSAWLTDWPMVKVLTRVRARAPRAHVIPARGHHLVQLVQARHRSGLPLRVMPGTEAAVINETPATLDVSLPALACVSDFRTEVRAVDATVTLTPLVTGIADAVRLFSYEEIWPGYLLPRTGTRGDELLRWIPPARVREGRRVRLRIQYSWGKVPVIWVE
ncbi:MAG TPA: hypothetical protein VEP50_17185 [bacterium]|nr:hypothetical protein [bacterium]